MPRSHGSPQVGGRPHVHPSLNCYKNHRCRCAGCREIHVAWQRENRRKKAAAIKSGTWVPAEHRRPAVLAPEEVARLRRRLGIESIEDETEGENQ